MNNLHSLEPWFISTPYTNYNRGHYGAFIDASRLSAEISTKYNVIVFCPIAHSHPMTTHGKLAALDHIYWERFNRPFIEKLCGGCVVVKLDGWDSSVGIAGEIRDFKAANKTILYCDPETLELSEA